MAPSAPSYGAGPVKQSAPRNDVFVESQIERAQKRIRLLDIMTALLGFLAGTHAFALVMAVADHWLTLSGLARSLAFGVYLLAAAIYLALAVVVPLTRRINPYYAARKVEETIPDAKNSVVNWLDLHEDEKLPGVIHQAVSQRAARDLAHVDLDRAVSGRRAGWTGVALGALFVIFLIVLFSLGYRKFFEHLERAFLPFTGKSAPRSTLLELLEPDGDVTVSADKDVRFRVTVSGKIPDRVRLLTRATLDDPDTDRFFEEVPGERGIWEAIVPGPEVKNGFHYRVAAGDATTNTYRVTVRASPSIHQNGLVAHYKQRPYTAQKVERVVRKQRDLADLRGTEVRLEVPTSRDLVKGEMEIYLPAAEGKNDSKTVRVPAVIDANDRKRMHFSFVLEQSGQYLIRFTSTEGESYADPLSYRIAVRADNAPKVELKKPGQNIAEAADGQVELEGVASDDIGVREIFLRIKVVDGETLREKPYRTDAEIRLADGGYPHVLDYLEVLDLAKLIDSEGRPYPLKAGQVLEYWLEARDACDFPEPNKGESQKYRITITEPKKNQKDREEKHKQAEQKKKEHQQKQDEQRKNENEKRKEDARKEKEQQEKEEKEQKQNEKGDGQKEEGKPGEGQKDDGKKEEGKPGEGKKDDGKEDAAQKARDEKARQNKEKLDEAARKAEEKERAEAKPDPADQKPGEGKDGGERNREQQKGEGKNKPENQPDPGKEGAKDRGKEEGKPEDQRGEGKKDGQPDEKKGEAKDGQGQQGDDKKAAGKQEGNQEKRPPERGEAKPSPDQKQDSGQDKGKEGQPEGKPDEKRGEGKAGKPEQGGEAKDGKADGMKDEKAAGKDGAEKQGQPDQRGEGKGKPEQQAGKGKEGAKPEQKQGEGKQAGKQEPGAGEKGTPKGGEKAEGQKDSKPAEGKEGARQGEAQKNGEGKPSGQKDAAQQAGQPKDGQKDPGQKNEPGQGKEAGAKPEQKQGDGKGEPKRTEGGKGKEGQKEQAAGKGKGGSPDDKKGQPGEQKPAGKPDEKVGEKKDGAVDGKGERSAEESRKEDVEKLTRELNTKDPAKREEARQKLEQIAKEGKDGDARQAAEKELEKDRQAQEEARGKAFQKLVDDLKSGDPKRQEEAEKQLGELSRKAKEAQKDAKPGEPEKPLSKQTKEVIEQLEKDMKSDDAKRREAAEKAMKKLQEASEKAGEGQPMPPQNKLEDFLKKATGGSGETGTGGKEKQTDEKDPTKSKDPTSDNRFRNQAGDLKLDRFSDRIKKKILKDAGLDEKDLGDIRDLLKRRPELRTDPDSPAKKDPGKGLATTGPERIKTGDGAKDLGAADQGLPPLEYRDAYMEFSKRFSGQKKDK